MLQYPITQAVVRKMVIKTSVARPSIYKFLTTWQVRGKTWQTPYDSEWWYYFVLPMDTHIYTSRLHIDPI